MHDAHCASGLRLNGPPSPIHFLGGNHSVHFFLHQSSSDMVLSYSVFLLVTTLAQDDPRHVVVDVVVSR